MALLDDDLFGDRSEGTIAGGLGFRYFIAKQLGMHISYSPDNGMAIDFQAGSACLGF